MTKNKKRFVTNYLPLNPTNKDVIHMGDILLTNGALGPSSNKNLRLLASNSEPFIQILLLVLILLTFPYKYVHAHGTADNYIRNGHVTEEFTQHAKIFPKIVHGVFRKDIQSTKQKGLHTKYIILTYKHNRKDVVLDLYLNSNLIPKNHFLRRQRKGVFDVLQNFTIEALDFCHYQGLVRGYTGSYAAISTCNGISGVVFDGHETYFISPGSSRTFSEEHFLFRNTDYQNNGSCGHGKGDQLGSIPIHHMPGLYNNSRSKRFVMDNVIRGPYNANRHSSYVELVMVVDNKVYKGFGESIKRVHDHCKEIANIVNALYMPLNIFIALVGVVIWNESNEIEVSNDGDATLKNFLHYRRKVLASEHPNDNAQLLTKEQFLGGVVGKALKGPICTYEYSGGVSMDHSQSVAIVATTVAHEMGHNFGMEHDTSDCKCVDEKCIMSAASTNKVPQHWSSCSIDQLNVAFSHGMNYCLRNKPTQLFDSPQCGNGFVEAGEQCDCGLPEHCENSCCDARTCMLHANASCATGECCDLTTCRPHTPGTVCRPTDGECDLPEFCTGESEYCPPDVYKRNTETCEKGNAYCYQGSCKSRSNQCKILWGPSGESSDHCYEKNIEGNRHGNCGYDRITNQYLQCVEGDVYCGMLHCRHLNERLEFGMESVAVLSHSFMNHKGNIIPCRTAMVDLGLQSIDPGLTPNGAKCGEGKMCVNQKCVSVESFRASGEGTGCSENCNGQGDCNSNGNCHCFEGFAPPFCNSPGPGGSEDSGPSTNPNIRAGFARVMYIFFLGVVPVVSLFLFFTYYWKQNRSLRLKKTSDNTETVLKPQLPGSCTSPTGLPVSTPSSTDDMNSALLKCPDKDSSLVYNEMFGKFKGFTLKPLPNADTSSSNAGRPNVALVHPVAKQTQESESFSKLAGTLNDLNDQLDMVEEKSIERNFGTNVRVLNRNPPVSTLSASSSNSSARVFISNPILEASTCTANELILSQKKKAGIIPHRPAPTIPVDTNKTFVQQIPEKKSKDGTIKKIASFLSKNDVTSIQAKKFIPIDKDKLKSIEISSPMPVITYMKNTPGNNSIQRAQSMRNQNVCIEKPNIHTFGSMRHPSDRPKSFVGQRPKSPPPRPPTPNTKSSKATEFSKGESTIVNLAGSDEHDYDDCDEIRSSNRDNSCDNIYSVIDEFPRPKIPSSSRALDLPDTENSMSLLGEIVNEIEKRSPASIYSASPINKDFLSNAVPNGKAIDSNPNFRNEFQKSPSSNLRSVLVETPIARVAPSKTENSVTNVGLSSFKQSRSKIESNFLKYNEAANRSPSKSTLLDNSKNLSTNKIASRKYLGKEINDTQRSRPPLKPTFSSKKVTNLKPQCSNFVSANEKNNFTTKKSNIPNDYSSRSKNERINSDVQESESKNFPIVSKQKTDNQNHGNIELQNSALSASNKKNTNVRQLQQKFGNFNGTKTSLPNRSKKKL